MAANSEVIFLKDYQPHPFRIIHSRIDFLLDMVNTTVCAVHTVERQRAGAHSLVLDCEKMQVNSIKVNQILLDESAYKIDQRHLTIHEVPDRFELEIENSINPTENTQLSGLYRSGDMLCTQCEAEGFRRITPAIDRPDNLATYEISLKANQTQFPVLLCNGNLISTRQEESHHSTVWQDPFPKPTYLFAVVAGPLSVMQDTFTTMSGREVNLRFYARDRDIEKCEYAVGALKRSMKWDEQVYAREYDLDLFNVVAVSDFNMGAMENKSLNIFNSKYVLADTTTATDQDFHFIESIIGHEYFHNWSGNRVTCRDWFQLSLKEGFTVFRDQEFSADMGSPGVQRINDVNALRNRQFPEDSGPMAHPVRPESYREINNFYTATVYEKGAEVVRMIRTIVGKEQFSAGTSLYFERHDGQAVTTDDFVAAISDASGVNFEQFKNWYSQSGTPEIDVKSEYDSVNKRYSLHFTQRCDTTPGQQNKDPFAMPISISLLSSEGANIPLDNENTETVLLLDKTSQTFDFENIPTEPVPSILRGFTSPVKLNANLDQRQLGILFCHDDDPFNRWEAGQKLFQNCIVENARRLSSGKECRFDGELIELVGQVVLNPDSDLAFIAKLLTLPGESWLAELIKPVNPQVIFEARQALREKIAASYTQELSDLYEKLQSTNDGSLTREQAAVRSLRDICINYLCGLDTAPFHELAENQFAEARNMTDRISAITAIANSTSPEKERYLEQFYQDWKHQELVINKWFRIQATIRRHDALIKVEQLCQHTAFDHANPNKAYALLLAFTHANPVGFHRPDGAGYRFLSHWVKTLDPVNPQVAARLVSGLNGWRHYISELSGQMHAELEQIARVDNLSRDVREIVSRALESQ